MNDTLDCNTKCRTFNTKSQGAMHQHEQVRGCDDETTPRNDNSREVLELNEEQKIKDTTPNFKLGGLET